MKARTKAASQLHGLVVTALDAQRSMLRGLTIPELVDRVVRWRSRRRGRSARSRAARDLARGRQAARRALTN